MKTLITTLLLGLSLNTFASNYLGFYVEQKNNIITIELGGRIQAGCNQKFNITALAIQKTDTHHYILELESNYLPLEGRNLCHNFQARAALTLPKGEILPHGGKETMVTLNVDGNQVGIFNLAEGTEVF